MGVHGQQSTRRMLHGIFGSTTFNILNKCNRSTFAISNRKEVIDMTLKTD
jgi:hypothetical protein